LVKALVLASVVIFMNTPFSSLLPLQAITPVTTIINCSHAANVLLHLLMADDLIK